MAETNPVSPQSPAPQASPANSPVHVEENAPEQDEAQHVVLEADDADNLDNDSAYGIDDQASEKTSLFSDIMKYREEPNDETEQNRLDLHHHIFTLAQGGKLYLAPIDKPARVLDVGTGTGIWAMDFGDAHPESHVVGTDLSPIQPAWVAPNVEFLIDDAEDEWLGQPFDYIHIRMLSGAIKDWPSLLRKAYNHLNPGGYIEITEFEVWLHSYNGSIALAPDIQIWQSGLKEAAEKFGRTMDVAVHLEEWLKDAGFLGVVQQKILVPDSPWPKDREQKMIGAYQLMNMLDAANSYGQAHFTRVLGWSIEEYSVLSARVRTQLKDRNLQSYSDLYTVYGYKPAHVHQHDD